MSTDTQPQLSPDQDARRLRRAFLMVVAFAGLLWTIRLVEVLAGLDLSGYALYPGRIEGLRGILFAPLLHGGFAHLIANTAPILVLGTALFYGYPKAARIVLPTVWLGSGLAVWLFARPAFHLGASGLTFGMMFFVFTVGVLRWERRAIALSLAVFLLYGGMIWGVLPSDPHISFEYHLGGAALGTLLAFLLKDLDPRAPEKVYSWEGEDKDDDWPFGDLPGQGPDLEPPKDGPRAQTFMAADLLVSFPGRCPGLACNAPSGLRIDPQNKAEQDPSPVANPDPVPSSGPRGRSPGSRQVRSLRLPGR